MRKEESSGSEGKQRMEEEGSMREEGDEGEGGGDKWRGRKAGSGCKGGEGKLGNEVGGKRGNAEVLKTRYLVTGENIKKDKFKKIN